MYRAESPVTMAMRVLRVHALLHKCLSSGRFPAHSIASSCPDVFWNYFFNLVTDDIGAGSYPSYSEIIP